jgi:multidrug efflux pump subunit AcrA (membrane-fusion protein)
VNNDTWSMSDALNGAAIEGSAAIERAPLAQDADASLGRRRPWRALLVGVLVGGLTIVAAVEHVQVRQRDAALDESRRANAALALDKATAEAELVRRSAELETKAAALAARATEREAKAAELAARVAEQERQVVERDRLLSRARQDAAGAAARVAEVEATGAALVAIIDLDNKLFAELKTFFEQVDALSRSIRAGDVNGARIAAGRVDQSLRRLDELAAQRDARVDRLRGRAPAPRAPAPAAPGKEMV